MKVDIVSESDENFKIEVKQFGEVVVATDGERVAIADSEELAIQAVEEMQVQNIKAKVPAPIEPQKGLGWFDGTSWGNK